MSLITAYSLPEHRDNPVVVGSADDLVAAVSELVDADNEYCSYMSVFVTNPAGAHTSYLGIGVDAARNCGSILFQGEGGEYYTQGADEGSSEELVRYLDFGNERVFPRNSQIDINQLKQALVDFYDGNFSRSSSLKWQVWSGPEIDVGDVSDLPPNLTDPWS
ncbi:Imm1 family immunity protein [Nocardia sp. NPDC058640]|uniref:Imm1 family immunity protein n=1 Tax=Nocardia sp. NPDC058640 TaxID=3346571 RepID=UPI0036608123